ncbi:MAG: HEAT repeat domain-containing protein [Sphingobacteriales bacterium]|nr:MAG: HEAT repeat domain-containing protein [Sphingobacteriales bacterium]
MPTLLTTVIPSTYIGTDRVDLPIGKNHIAIQLRFTVFGELLEYVCPAIELPEAALKLTFTAEDLKLIQAEIAYLPYRLMLMAFMKGNADEIPGYSIWHPLMVELKQLRNGYHMRYLKLPVTHEFARELKEWVIQKRRNLNFNMIFDGNAIGQGRYMKSANLTLPTLCYHLIVGKTRKVRQKAVEMLGKLEDKRAVEPLISVLNDVFIDVRYNAVKYLGKLGDVRAVVPLLTLLQDKVTEVRIQAIIALGNLGDSRATAPLIPFLGNSMIDIRNYTAIALGNLADTHAVGPLIRTLSDKAQKVRMSVAESLGKLGDVRAVMPLITTLRSKAISTGCAGAKALGNLNDKRAVLPLISALSDKNLEVRINAATALGKLGDVRAIEPLTKVSKIRRVALRKAAKFALDRLRLQHTLVTASATLAEKLPEKVSTTSINQINDQQIGTLITAAKSKNFNTRSTAVMALGKSGDARAFEILIAAINDKYSRVRCSAVTALGNLGDARAVQALLAALKDKNMNVRYRSASALATLGDSRAVVPVLSAAMKDNKGNYYEAACRLSVKCKDIAIPQLLIALSNRKYKIRLTIAELLGAIGDIRALGPLQASLQKETSIKCKRAKANAISRINRLNAVIKPV